MKMDTIRNFAVAGLIGIAVGAVMHGVLFLIRLVL